MMKELINRMDKMKTELESINKLPETIAIKKGQLMQNTVNTEEEKQNSSVELDKSEKEYEVINKQLKIVEQKMILARENK